MSGIIDQWSNNEKSYCHGIVCKNCMARKFSEEESTALHIRIGTFVQVHSVCDDKVLFYIVRNDMQVELDQLICSRSDIIYVPENLWGPLFTVEPGARLALVENSKIAEIMGNISVGHRVQVLGPDYSPICYGTVTFKNSITRLGVGVYFGLKIESFKENLQVIIKTVSLLEPNTKGFPRGCDIVVSVDKIHPLNINYNEERLVYHQEKEVQAKFTKNQNTSTEDLASKSYKSATVLNLKEKSLSNVKKSQQINCSITECNLNHISSIKNINSDNPLRIGDKIVYFEGNQPEFGVVRWLGSCRNSIKVGVEFDNPIGKGTGTFDGVELFRTKEHHALIVPAKALVKLSDFMMNSSFDTFQYKNNYFNLNNNNNNNSTDLRPTEFLCCDKKANTEEKFKMVKSDSNQRFTQPGGTFCCGELFQTNEEILKKKHACVNEGFKAENTCVMQTRHNFKSIELQKSNERKQCCRSQCNSVDNTLLQRKDSKVLYSYSQRSPSQDLFDFMGPNLINQPEPSHNCEIEGKTSKSLDDDEFSADKIMTNLKGSLSCLNNKDVWNSQYVEHSSSNESISNFYDSLKTSSCNVEDFGKGSLVELTFKEEPHYGVIRWIGTIPEYKGTGSCNLIAGIEMEEEENGFTDGTFKNKRYFQCNPRKALFVPLNKCKKDSRFIDETHRQSLSSKVNYGQIDCPVVEGIIPPINTKGDIQSICGKNRGIQGHHNSCYLDATLFSMFAFTCVFDSLLYRPPTKYDLPQYSEVQRVLRDEIVNPLRKNLYVRADRVMKLRTLLDKLSSISGLTSEEKDPEEFLNSLLAQILKAEPFLKLSSGQEAFHYQLFVEKDERLVFPTVQQLFEQSFVTSDIKLKQVPPCLIIQMPRFGKSFKMYSKILPPQLLDVTDIIENSPRQCTVCGKSAEFECKDCFGQSGIGNGLESISFCRVCLNTAHTHHCRTKHSFKALTVPVEFSELQEHCIIPRLYMELFAVVCIETSHYVAFVKCGSGSDAPWCFFDSMADRKGEQNGYNIPEMIPCPDLSYWLSEDGAKVLNEPRDEKQLPEYVKRLFSDAYMCMYQSPDMMMYR